MISSFNVVDVVRKCYKNAAVKDILKMEKNVLLQPIPIA